MHETNSQHEPDMSLQRLDNTMIGGEQVNMALWSLKEQEGDQTANQSQWPCQDSTNVSSEVAASAYSGHQ